MPTSTDNFQQEKRQHSISPSECCGGVSLILDQLFTTLTAPFGEL